MNIRDLITELLHYDLEMEVNLVFETDYQDFIETPDLHVGISTNDYLQLAMTLDDRLTVIDKSDLEVMEEELEDLRDRLSECECDA